MPDKSVVISSFKYGLDTRRESLASLPGTLQTCQNAHINSGGEAEKRKAFVKDANTFPTNTFGLQDTDSGLMTFGSDAAANAALPTGVVYQQLVYPRSTAPGNMAAVLYSCCFKGKAFVLVSFDNEQAVFAYYNGTLVAQITDGIVLTSPGGSGGAETVSDLSTDLAAIVDRIPDWIAHSNVGAGAPGISPSVGYNEYSLLGSTLVMSPPGVHFTPVVENNNSAAGLLGARLLDQNFPGIPAAAGYTAFDLAGTSGSIEVQGPVNADGSGVTSLTNGEVNFHSTLAQTAQDLATAINNSTYLAGYTAIAGAQTVTIYTPTSFGTASVQLTVITTASLTAAASGTPGASFALILTPNGITSTVTVPHGTNGLVQGSITASSTGAGAAVTYTWTPLSYINSEQDNPPLLYSAGGVAQSSLTSTAVTGNTCQFAFGSLAGRSVIATIQCKAHDGVHPDITTTFVVSFNINY